MNAPQAQPSQFYDEGVRLISYCPLCQASYSPRQTRVLGEKEDSHLLHIECGNCGNAILALVLVSAAGVSSTGIVTDMGSEEFDSFKAAPAISTDDVIDMHHLLQDEDDFFNRLLA